MPTVIVSPNKAFGVIVTPQSETIRLGTGTQSPVSHAAYDQANAAYNVANAAIAQANQDAVWLQGQPLIPNVANINFSNSATVNVTANIFGNQANVEFAVNASAIAAETGANGVVLTSGSTMTGELTIVASGTGLSVTNTAAFGNVSVGNQISTNTVSFGSAAMTSIVLTTTQNGGQVIADQFSASQFATVSYKIQVQTINALQATELFSMQDGLNTYTTEYSTLLTAGVIGTFAVTLSGTTMFLYFTPNNPLNQIITLKILRQTINA